MAPSPLKVNTPVVPLFGKVPSIQVPPPLVLYCHPARLVDTGSKVTLTVPVLVNLSLADEPVSLCKPLATGVSTRVLSVKTSALLLVEVLPAKSVKRTKVL